MLKDRWSYTSKHDKKQFFYTVFIISSIVLLQFILLGITADIISSITAGYFSLFFSSLEEQEFYSLANNVISILNLWGSFSISSALLILFLRRTKNKNESNAGSSISFKFKMPENMLMLLFLGLSIVYLFATLSIFFDFFIGMFGAEKTPYEPVAFPKTAVGIIVYFLALVVSPALVEEFFCRYLILNALRKYGDGFAMIVSAVFFGLMHGRTTAFFFATAIGFFLAYFAIKTGSIWFPVILHAFINFMSLFWHLMGDLITSNQLFELVSGTFWTVLFGVSFIYIIVLALKKKDLSLVRHRYYIKISPARKLFAFFNAAAIIFIVLALLQSTVEYRNLW